MQLAPAVGMGANIAYRIDLYDLLASLMLHTVLPSALRHYASSKVPWKGHMRLPFKSLKRLLAERNSILFQAYFAGLFCSSDFK